MASALSASASLKSAVSFVPKETVTLKAPSATKAFGLKSVSGRVSCSIEDDVKSLLSKFADAGKVAAVSLAAAALVSFPAEAAPKRLTFDELQSQTYSELKGTGIANQCPTLSTGVEGFAFPAGEYRYKKLCMEPTSFTVKAETPFKGAEESFQKVKLMTRLTYTLDEIEGQLNVAKDGTVSLTEEDGIDYAAVTVQLSGGERVPFLFTIKELAATGTPDAISGTFMVPSYRGSTFLDPKGRGGSTGYDNAVALPAGGRGDEEELGKENTKDTRALSGSITFSVAKSDPATGELVGIFTSLQPSDTDLGAKVPKDVKIEGIWYAQVE